MSYSSTIFVYSSGGTPLRGAKVSLCFDGLFSGGFTRDVYTDSRGVAQIDHSSRGTATVYVSGRRRGQFHAPGRTTVTA